MHKHQRRPAASSQHWCKHQPACECCGTTVEHNCRLPASSDGQAQQCSGWRDDRTQRARAHELVQSSRATRPSASERHRASRSNYYWQSHSTRLLSLYPLGVTRQARPPSGTANHPSAPGERAASGFRVQGTCLRPCFGVCACTCICVCMRLCAAPRTTRHRCCSIKRSADRACGSLCHIPGRVARTALCALTAAIPAHTTVRATAARGAAR